MAMINISASETPLTDAELDQVEQWLDSDAMPETAMDISMLDGFFTALISGPNLVHPTRALPWIWDSEEGQAQPGFETPQQFEQVVGLLMRYWNMLANTLNQNPDAYAPLIYLSGEGDAQESIIEEWCTGYMLGIALDPHGWAPMLDEPSDEISLIMLYGTESGWEELDRLQLGPDYQRDAADALADCATAIHAYWRKATAPPIRNTGKIGRNDPCSCGSGKKFKLCHGAPAANEA